MKKKRYKLNISKFTMAVLFFGVALGAVFLSADQTLAWLMPKEKAEAEVAISDFKVEGKAYNRNSGAEIDMNHLSLDKGKANYLGDLKYVVQYEGISPAILRVRILEQWVDSTTNIIRDMQFTDYLVQNCALNSNGMGPNTVWYDNRSNDFCYYYAANAGLLSADSVVTNGGIVAGKKEVVLIDGVNMTANATLNDGNTNIKFVVDIQAVQPNRYREFFGIAHLPWE